jgi:hypothetical protein
VNLEDRHPSTVAIARYFTYKHLPISLRPYANACAGVAEEMIEHLPDSPELTAGLRNLLQAKDCFVRAALDNLGEQSPAQAQAKASPVAYVVDGKTFAPDDVTIVYRTEDLDGES